MTTIKGKSDSLKSMRWSEFGEYLYQNTELTEQQSMILAGKSYRIDSKDIARSIGTTAGTVRTQSTELDLSELNEIAQKEVWKTPVPATPFQHIGNIEYFMTDEWPHDGRSGSVDIYCGIKPDVTYVAVVEKWTLTYENGEIETDGDVWGMNEDRERTTIYPNAAEFRSHSPHSPENLPEIGSDMNIEAKGVLFN